ncbi:unnamed protein product [Gordionus sp. m RMFG-2023]
MHAAIKDKAYVVDVEIIDESNCKIKEKFTAYCYPGHLPGNCMGFNNNIDPFIITMNGLSAKHVGILDSTPRGILCRAVIGKCYDMKSLLSILYDFGRGTAVGFSINIGISGNNNICHPSPNKFFNVEVAPSLTKFGKSQLNVLQIDIIKKYYVHFNKYERLQVPEISEFLISSQHREKVVQTFGSKLQANNIQDMLEILGDTSDNNYPIFRESGIEQSQSITLATGIFDMDHKEWTLYDKNPKFNKPIFKIDIK